jgi:hypothetical protein
MTTKPDMAKLAEIDAELAAYSKAIKHEQDDGGFDAKATHIDELMRARMRAMGLPEDEIARIEQESEAAVDEQLASEVEAFLQNLPKPAAR